MGNIGKQGERIFQEIMEGRGYEVVDVSNNPDYWNKDVDFIITSPTTGLTKTFEVKFDSRINRTGNLYLELTNIHSKQWNYDGWWPHCQADSLVYGDAVSSIFYVIPLLELRERIEKLNCRCANCGYDSTGLLVPLGAIADITQVL